jgi:hypothetical protein
MKKLYTLLTFIITLTISAQSPQGFNYQATVRNNAGALMVNQNVTFKFNVIKDTPTSVPVFSETHYVPTDDLGAVNLVIGKGTATTGTFATIDWATGTYYLGIELNTGNGFKAMGTTQLLSVPYALYASNSGNGTSIGDISTSSNPKGATITSGTLSLTPADATNGGILTTGSQTIVGSKTFSSDVTINGITVGKGDGNIASNTVIGNSSLTSNTTGNSNTAIGFSSLDSNTTGGNNIAIGEYALPNNTIGNNNIAIGNMSLRANFTGNNNTAIGTSTGFSVFNLNNATAIGYRAMVDNSNTIQLGDPNITDVKTSGKITATGFKTPNGTSSQHLMADGSVSNAGGSGFSHYIGELYGGGIIVSLWKISGIEHGLVASLNDLGTGITWSNIDNIEIGITAQSPNNGRSNTNAIIAQSGHSTSAAKLCDEYVSGGFSDWYLPSIWELNQCVISAHVVNEILGDNNGFLAELYHSSTEYDDYGFRLIDFKGFGEVLYSKTSTCRVRAVRKF